MPQRPNGDICCDLGTWLDSAVRNLPPTGEISWQGMPRRSYTASIGRTVLATVRRNPHHAQWVVSMPGFVWDVSGERGSSTHTALGIESSPVRAFKTSVEGRRAVEEAYTALQQHR